MARSLILLLLLLGNLSLVHAQLQLECLDNGKTKTLKTGGSIELVRPMTGVGICGGERTISGKLIEADNKLIKILPKKDEQRFAMDNGMVKVSTANYEQLQLKNNMTVEIAGLSRVEYRSKSADEFHNLGGIITTIGSLSALLAAPLVSINYKEGGFNKERYYNWAGTSLAATGLGVVMLISTKKKIYHLEGTEAEKVNKRWKISVN